VTNASRSSFARLRARIHCGPAAIQKIGRFVLKSSFRARNLSSEELAQACGASAAAVYMLCRDLEYDGYPE
jgi:DNA-binding MurR/RpiR family transcriptional regulator